MTKLPLTFDIYGTDGDYCGSAELSSTYNMSCCPFCRGNNVHARNTWTPFYHVECDDCDAQGPSPKTTDKTTFATVAAAKSAHRRAITAAIEAWEDRL